MTNKLTRQFFAVFLVLLLVACTAKVSTQKSQSVSQSTASEQLESSSAATATPGQESVFRTTPEFSPGTPFSSSLSQTFPKPPTLEPQVAFWRNVYGVWSRSQVAIHDDRYLNLVYEVIRLPGEITGGYTPNQKALLGERLDYWKFRLRDLEQKLASNSPLSGDEQRLVAQMGHAADIRTAIRGASERVRIQRGLRERFRRGLEISGRYDRHFRNIFRSVGLPEDLAYLPHVESSFQANARSSAGAVGIWQFTQSAAKAFMGGTGSVEERLDPIASARGAARYLSHAYDQLGSWPLALTSYNHGIGGMQRAKDRFGHDFMRIVYNYDHPLFGFASRNFYAEFLAAREVASHPEFFFPEGVVYEQPLDWSQMAVVRSVPVAPAPRAYVRINKRQSIAAGNGHREPAKANRYAKNAAAGVTRLSSSAVRPTGRPHQAGKPSTRKVADSKDVRRAQPSQPKARVAASRPNNGGSVSKSKVAKVADSKDVRRVQAPQPKAHAGEPRPNNSRTGSKYKVAQAEAPVRR
jgi:membrane-bound lytic murein transglycosylase D